jgi:hypothetical protein
MWNRHHETRGAIRRIFRSLGNSEGFAAVDAVSGDLAPLFTLEACRRTQLGLSQRLSDQANPPPTTQHTPN